MCNVSRAIFFVLGEVRVWCLREHALIGHWTFDDDSLFGAAQANSFSNILVEHVTQVNILVVHVTQVNIGGTCPVRFRVPRHAATRGTNRWCCVAPLRRVKIGGDAFSITQGKYWWCCACHCAG